MHWRIVEAAVWAEPHVLGGHTLAAHERACYSHQSVKPGVSGSLSRVFTKEEETTESSKPSTGRGDTRLVIEC